MYPLLRCPESKGSRRLARGKVEETVTHRVCTVL
jgi:hypothetical protein